MDEVLSSFLVPASQPVTVLQAGENLQSVRFNLINFSTLDQMRPPALLEAGPWHVEIKPLPKLFEIKKELSAESGYGLTHEGSIQRSDGESFSPEEAQELLDILYLFLSFARGGSCGVTLIVGSDENGSKVWEQWGTYSTYPWFSLSSWLDHRYSNDDSLSSAFPGFWQMLERTTGAPGDPVRIALYWYLRSNESNNPYSGIILTQAALERLANLLLPSAKYETLKGKRKADEKMIRDALKQAEIECAIPDCLKNLRKIAKRDGPEILTELRNDLVHAKMNRESVCLEAYLEAQNLGQWYVELLLLRLFGYEGEYANRLAYKYERIWKPEIVPWVRGIKGAG